MSTVTNIKDFIINLVEKYSCNHSTIHCKIRRDILVNQAISSAIKVEKIAKKLNKELDNLENIRIVKHVS